MCLKPNRQIDIRYAFQKKSHRQLLGILVDVLRHKWRNHPPPSHTFYQGYLPSPSKVNQKQRFGVPVYEPQMSKRLKDTLTILTVWGDNHKPGLYAWVGQQSLKPYLRQNPQMRKNLGLCFDKKSERYILSPSLHTASCLTPV